MRRLIVPIIFVLRFAGLTNGQLVISEVLANEPGNRVLLEWLEIYNNGAQEEYLNNWKLINNNDTLTFPDSTVIAAGAYAIICRRLEPVDSGDCFEYHWGDSSGVWGDSPQENFMAVSAAISLPNSLGDLYLLDSLSQIIDQCHWRTSCADGQSLERDDVTELLSGWHPCTVSSGSTPGRENSQKPAEQPDDVFTVNPRVVSLSTIEPHITITCNFPSGTNTTLSIFDDSGRKRITLADKSVESNMIISWPCMDGHGDRLEPGMYILRLLTTGSLNLTKTVPLVIAP